jgi:predicted RNA-binding Zn ribbon-like protein
MVTPRFDLSGGRPCLDLPNTVSNRGSGAPVDHLAAYEDVVAWAEQGTLVSPALARELKKYAAGDPAAARRALAKAVALREALFRIFVAIAAGRRPPAGDLALLNAEVPPAFAHARVVRADGGRYTLATGAAGADLPSILAPVVKSAVDLLTSADVDRVRSCAADTCEWLFLDTTKNRTRRWCDMKVCGNRAKVRRFRTRH